jgi:Holliday junction resolvase RusA-like endonuclease
MSSDVVYEAVIPIEPRSKKNSQQICINSRTKRPFVKQNDKYVQFEKDCGFFLKQKPPAPIDYPVNVKCIFYRSTRIRCDLVNLQEAILDVLTRYEIIADDNFNIVATMDGSTVLIDKDNPRIEITITKETDL